MSSSKMSFSKEQETAINAGGENYLISAGAGSGKTAVLTERIYRIAKKDNTLDKFLVVTFTNLAALEMKDRVRGKLLDDEQTQHLASEVDNAHIETFDSFSLYLAKKYFYELDINKDLNIVDGTVLRIKMMMIVEEVFDEKYSNHDSNFENLINKQCVKNDDTIKNFVISLLLNAEGKIDKYAYLNHLKNDFFKENFINDTIDNYYKELIESIKYVQSLAYQLDNVEDSNQIVEFTDQLLANNSYDELYEMLKTASFPRKKTDKDNPGNSELRDELKAYYDKHINLKDKDYGTSQQIKESYLSTKDSVIEIIDLAIEVEKRFDEFKRNTNAYTFSDISKFVIKLLDNENIRNEISNSFDYIMVDEYQDTNDVQDYVVTKIARNNVYMVGDVKQSIYRFRGADSRIFQEKYVNYKLGKGGREIDLNKSYRSRREVVNFINELFEVLMDKNIQPIDYKNGHNFEFGRLEYEVNKPKCSYLPEVYTYQYEKGINFAEKEAEIIARDIQNRINDGYLVYDNKAKTSRKCNFSDFAIIIDRTTDFDEFRKKFASYNIPLKVEAKEKLFKTDVVSVIKSLLRMLYYSLSNDYGVSYKHAFFSVARSFLYQYHDDDLYIINKEKKYLLEPFAQKIELLKESLRYASLKKVLETLLNEFDIYDSISRITNYYANTHKLESLINIASNMDVLGYTLDDFIKYFDDLQELDIDIDYKENVSVNNAVTLINIHGSKGLEYGIVYFPQLYKEFNRDDIKKSFLISENYGIAIPSTENSDISSLFISRIRQELTKLDFEEKIRLLYVALTRAKEKIIFINRVKENEKRNHQPTDSKSMKDILNISDVLEKYDVNYSMISNEVVLGDSEQKVNKIKLKTIHIPAKIVKRSRASKEINDDVDTAVLDLGNELHAYLEGLDFENDDLSYITNPRMKKYVYNIRHSNLFKGIKNEQIRHEFPFYDEINNVSGYIDALIIKDDEIDIIDFKLRNIDEVEYDKQLRTYKRYVVQNTNLPIKMYLLAAITGEVREVYDAED